MGLVVYWYDFICFGIVAAAVLGAAVVLVRKEGAAEGILSWRRRLRRAKPEGEPFKYESLFLPILEDYEEDEGDVRAKEPAGLITWEEMWMSCWVCLHPAVLLVVRFVALVVMVLLLAWDIDIWGGTIYVYYTEWTFTLVIIYFGLATLISIEGCYEWYKQGSVRDQHETTDFLRMDTEQEAYAAERAGENINENTVRLQRHQEQENRKKAGFWGYTMQILFQTCAGSVVMTDIVFWVIIVPFLSTERFSLNLLMGSMHSVNAFFLIVDSALNSMHFPWFRGAYFMLWTALYVIFQWIIHACGFSWWPYPFLELSTAWAPLWYFALAILCIPCYGLFTLLIKGKERYFPKWFPHAYQNLN
uniref:Uncharacterized protein n=1 Tax=Picea sitchensis TaxID=3332 RepID=A9P267_PICSI|nr:unknown [Picea sitchensis]